MKTGQIRIGIDIGSTTAKVVVMNPAAEIIYSAYRRHNAETLLTLKTIIQEASQELELGDVKIDLLITGSAGMGISEKFDIPFIQEVVASAEVVRQLYPEVKTLIDIGGEDAKMIFFKPDGAPDIRMNGACAGGTGAFIDEMAMLLNIPVSELDNLAKNHTTIYPIASRCGVFAKTDMQNLLSREIPWEDIAASVFNAVALQTLSTLSRGNFPSPQILFSGGPLTFLPSLQSAFMRVLSVDQNSVMDVDNAELLPAIGAALANNGSQQKTTLTQLIDLLNKNPKTNSTTHGRLLTLFEDELEFKTWEKARSQHQIEKLDVSQLNGDNYFLGVDSGSTTTKVVLIDDQGRIAFDYYHNNNGNPINTVREGLKKVQRTFEDNHSSPNIVKSVVTGYGEDLIRMAFGFDDGVVETLAHFRAAKAYDEDVTFILDIGGQDMKAIFVNDGHIQNIEINEACSSGCGTFIESFARSTGNSVSDFAEMACASTAPCDLGSRCTVFMNSKVKQSLREGAEVEDISAGLAYSVIKNALHKVLKVTNPAVLGDHIIVQGGTFRNPAVHRAIEHLLEKPVLCPEIPELMGAYGAALTALDTYDPNQEDESNFVEFDELDSVGPQTKRHIRCRGCENNCNVTKLIFQNKNVFFTGNRCEKIYTNSGKRERKGISLPDLKYELLFDREMAPSSTPALTVGIPRGLNLYENFPFWNTLFVESGIKVHLSDPSTSGLAEKGVGTIMSENICYPAKIMHGHIFNLIDAEVDRIFFPMVFYEEKEFVDSDNCYNCPILSGYPDVIRSAIDPEGKYGIPLDMPAINFNDKALLKKACTKYLKGLGIGAKTIRRAFEQAVKAQQKYKESVRALGAEILKKAREDERPVILLMGRPYQIDPMINLKTPEMLINFGMDVITEDAIPKTANQTVDGGYALTQWTYSNRFYHAAHWAGQQPNVEVVQLNSFGCGPDASVVDNIKSILGEYSKGHTVIRVDEIKSTGSTKLRLRSMIELLNKKEKAGEYTHTPGKNVRPYLESDRDKTLIIPQFSHFCAPSFISPILQAGFNIETLPPSNRQSVEVGLKYTNNDICYPGLIVIGDVIKALQSGKYDLTNVAVAFFQTGGQCRASSYLPLLKRALLSSGFEDIPIVSLSTAGMIQDEQSGFNVNIKELLSKMILSISFSDALSTMYHAAAIREVHKGEARQVADKYLAMLDHGTIPLDKEAILETLGQAVADFNNIETVDRDYPVVAIVGEIYLKYNTFGNHNAAQWLMDQGIEVIVPPLMKFFTGILYVLKGQVKSSLKRMDIPWLIAQLTIYQIQTFVDDIDKVMKEFRYYRPSHAVKDMVKKVEDIVEMTHQYGESWLVAGEIAAFMEDGVKNVLCLQPFGCIANHVIAKGIGTRIKEKFPQLNLLYLDLDPGTSEVNFFNRLHFFIDHTKSEYNKTYETENSIILNVIA